MDMRSIIGIIIGYLILAFVVGSIIIAAGMSVGEERLVNAQTSELSTWFIFMIEWPVSLMGAVFAGLFTAFIAEREQRPRAITALATIVVAIGCVSFVWQFIAQIDNSPAGIIEAEVAGPVAKSAELEVEAALIAQKTGTQEVRREQLPTSPLWDAIALPIVTALGVFIGGGLLSPRGHDETLGSL